MAWLTKATTARGIRRFRVHWRDHAGAHHSWATKTGDPRIAEMHRRRIEREKEGRILAAGKEDAAAILSAFTKSARLTKSVATARSYGDYLGQLVRAWAHVPPSTWGVAMWEEFVKERRALSAARATAPDPAGLPRGWSVRTVQIAASGAREWIRFARDRGLPLADFVGTWKSPHQPRRKVRGAPLATLRRLLAAAEGTRYELPIALGACAGLRRSEIVGLKVADVDPAHGRITVRSAKGRPDRVLPIPPILAEVLRRRLPEAGAVVSLPQLEGTYRTLRSLCRRAGIEYLSWHRLRHAFATVMLYEGGAKLHEVQAALGHASLATTGIYLDAHLDEIRAASERAFT